MTTNPTQNGGRPVMDVREPIAKMRAQAEQNRRRCAEIEADAQRFMAEAQAKFNELIAAANVQQEEAAFWDALAAEQEAKAGILAPLDVAAGRLVASGGPADTAPMPQDGGEER